MPSTLCSLWWLLAAVLTGWLLCGWFARQYLFHAGASADDGAVIAGLKRRIAELESMPRAAVSMPAAAPVAAPPAPALDFAAARAAGFAVRGPDDLEIIEGIGPKIAQLLHAAGVHTFAQLAAMTPAQIQPVLDAAGPNYRIANPQSWPEQATLAAADRWADLKALQDSLTAGRKA